MHTRSQGRKSLPELLLNLVGLQGLRLFELGDPSTADPEELPCFPILAELAQSGDKLWFYGGEAQMALLERVLAALPQLTVVLNHLGFWPTGLHVDEHGRPQFTRGYTAEGLAAVERLARLPRVFVLFSGLYAFSLRGDDRRVQRHFGSGE